MWRESMRSERVPWVPLLFAVLYAVCCVSCRVLLCCDVKRMTMTMAGFPPVVVWAYKLDWRMDLSVGFCLKWSQWCELRGRARVLGPTALLVCSGPGGSCPAVGSWDSCWWKVGSPRANCKPETVLLWNE